MGRPGEPGAYRGEARSGRDNVALRDGVGRWVGGTARHGGWSMWKACMDNLNEKHASAWVVMERYNKRDVKMTERLYRKLRPWFEQTHGFKRLNEWLLGQRNRP